MWAQRLSGRGNSLTRFKWIINFLLRNCVDIRNAVQCACDAIKDPQKMSKESHAELWKDVQSQGTSRQVKQISPWNGVHGVRVFCWTLRGQIPLRLAGEVSALPLASFKLLACETNLPDYGYAIPNRTAAALGEAWLLWLSCRPRAEHGFGENLISNTELKKLFGPACAGCGIYFARQHSVPGGEAEGYRPYFTEEFFGN